MMQQFVIALAGEHEVVSLSCRTQKHCLHRRRIKLSSFILTYRIRKDARRSHTEQWNKTEHMHSRDWAQKCSGAGASHGIIVFAHSLHRDLHESISALEIDPVHSTSSLLV